MAHASPRLCIAPFHRLHTLVYNRQYTAPLIVWRFSRATLTLGAATITLHIGAPPITNKDVRDDKYQCSNPSRRAD